MNPLNHSFSYNKRIYSNYAGSIVNQLTENIFQELNSYSRLEHIRKLALNNLLCNLLISSANTRYLAVSKNRNNYSNFNLLGLTHYTYRLIVGWINLLIKEGYVNQIPGYFDIETETGIQTRLTVAERFITSINEFENFSQDFEFFKYDPPIILKDVNKNVLTYPISGRIREWIKFLNEYNEFLSGIQITLPIADDFFRRAKFIPLYPLNNDCYFNIYHIINTTTGVYNNTDIPLLRTLDPNRLRYKDLQGHLYRVFNNGKFTEGGRFYGAEYQQLNENDRSKILIDGSPVVEVDYSSFHLNMLYHKTKKQFDGDPYTKVSDIPELRPILKVLNLIAINSKTPAQALRAIKNEIRKSVELQRLKRIYNLDERELLRKFESTHYRISNYFYSGIGIKLQNLDSSIAELVLKHFTGRGIPCLCVHDSFLVPQKHRDELIQIMKETYFKILGYNPVLKG